MSILVNSLTRLYKSGRLTKEQVVDRVKKGTITEDEYAVIAGETYEGKDV